MKCEGNTTGRFDSDVALKSHCTDMESWYHKMIKFLAIELFEVKPDPYKAHIVPDVAAAFRDNVGKNCQSLSSKDRDISENDSSKECFDNDDEMMT